MKGILLLTVLFTTIAANAQTALLKSKTTIYLVRHAEKEKDKDPLLTTAGKERAGDLYRTLEKKKIGRIYTTPYRRTIMTGDSLRVYQGIDTVRYAADTLSESLPHKIVEKSDLGKTILVIGHSNTVPALIRKLGVKDYAVKELPETEFDNLFVITYKRGKAKLKIYKYGK